MDDYDNLTLFLDFKMALRFSFLEQLDFTTDQNLRRYSIFECMSQKIEIPLKFSKYPCSKIQDFSILECLKFKFI